MLELEVLPLLSRPYVHEHCEGNLEFQRLQLQYGNCNTTLSNTLNYKLNLYEEEMKCF